MSEPRRALTERWAAEAPAAESAAFSKSEMMIVAAARELVGQRVCFVGVGLPNIAVNLARLTVAPELELVYESGAFGAKPARLPLSIGDPTIVTGATAAVSMFELFSFYLQGGLVDVGFLGAAQIDRYGNLNSTVIGDYEHPKTRLPGSGGACEIAINARHVFVIMRQSKRSFVDLIDFRTSPGNLGGAETAARIRREQGWLGRGPSLVVTDLGIYHFDDSGEMRLDSIHPGATLEQVRATMGWEPRVAEPLPITPAPTPEELRLIRDELDPEGAYTKEGSGGDGLGSVPRRLGLASNHHDRAMRVADDEVGDAADQKAGYAAATVRADHDEIGALRVRGGNYGLARVAFPDQESGIGPRRACFLDDRLGVRREGVASLGGVTVGSRRFGVLAPRSHDADHEQPRADLGREVDRLLTGRFGRARAVGGKQNCFVARSHGLIQPCAGLIAGVRVGKGGRGLREGQGASGPFTWAVRPRSPIGARSVAERPAAARGHVCFARHGTETVRGGRSGGLLSSCR